MGVGALGAASVEPAGAVDVAGGRVTLQAPARVLDTQTGIGVSTGLTTELTLPANGALTVTLTGPSVPGEALVHPCATPATASSATFVYEAGETLQNNVVTGSAPTCLTSTSPVHVAVDRHGAVADAATPSGLQYVPLAAPLDVSPADTVTGEATLNLGSSVPATASATVLAITAATVGTTGALTMHACGVARPAATDMVLDEFVRSTVAYTPLSALGANQQCLFSPTAAAFLVRVLGYLQTTGPDPTLIPPTLHFTATDVPPPGLRAIAPTRLLDTRIGTGAKVGKVLAGQTLVLDLAAVESADTTAAVLNVTATEPDAPGYVTVYPCDVSRPTASNLNFAKGQTAPNQVTVPVARDGTVCLFVFATTHLVADVTATYEFGRDDRASAVTPARLLDTRVANGVATAGKVRGGSTLVLGVAGRGGVPAAGATAVTMNVTVTEPDAPGFLTVFPCDSPKPLASNLNYVAGQTVPNAVTVKLSAAGTVCIYTPTTTHVVADVGAWFGPAGTSGYEEVTPARVLDTRVQAGPAAPYGVSPVAKVTASTRTAVQIQGRFGVPPARATAVTLNVTVTDPDAAGYLTVFPCDKPQPLASNLNYARNQTVANQVTVPLSAAVPQVAAEGTVCFVSQQTTNVVIDVAGYFTNEPEQSWAAEIS